jgi:hypothetical protein
MVHLNLLPFSTQVSLLRTISDPVPPTSSCSPGWLWALNDDHRTPQHERCQLHGRSAGVGCQHCFDLDSLPPKSLLLQAPSDMADAMTDHETKIACRRSLTLQIHVPDRYGNRPTGESRLLKHAGGFSCKGWLNELRNIDCQLCGDRMCSNFLRVFEGKSLQAKFSGQRSRWALGTPSFYG